MVRAVGIYFPLNGRFYVMGGRSADTVGSDFPNPFEYNPNTNTWVTKVATYPDNQVNDMACGVLTVGGTPLIYCVGGSAAGAATATARVFSYNPVTDVITTLTVADNWLGNTAGTILPGGFAVAGNKLYIIGGYDIGTGSTVQTWQFNANAAVGSRWLQHLDYPLARSYIPTAAVGGLIYTGGGSNIVGATVTDTADSFRYDPIADTWTAIANIPRATGETRAVIINNQMLVLGGGRTAPNPSTEVDVYNPNSNTWTIGLPLMMARRDFPADSDGSSRFWLVGGYDTGGLLLNTMEAYGPGVCATPTPTPTPASPTPTATPTSGIVLVSRVSDARAYAAGGGATADPPPEIQTDFLPASLANNAMSYGEPGGAEGHCTSNSWIAVDNQMGTLDITGDGGAWAGASKPGGSQFYAWAAAKLIVINFTLTDRSYAYSLTGQLSANGETSGHQHSNLATAKLTRGGVTIFEVIADHSTVPISETGILQPDNYTLAVEVDAYAQAPSSFGNSSANFNFALGPAPTPTPTATGSPTPTATPTATATPSPTPAAQALNLSTRMLVQIGDNVGIGGFIITGSAPKQVTVRGLGPSLAGSGVPNPLADPVLELHGPPGFTTIINDNWRDSQDGCLSTPELRPTNDLESAICGVTLDPGAYTAILRDKNNGTGIGLVEVYDVDQSAPSKLANISTRAFVSTGGDVVIAGFILGNGSGDDNVILRGIGPSLASAGVPNVLADPTLELRDGNGALLLSNNDWQDAATETCAVIVAGAGLAPTNNLESAICATLPPGSYTALLAGLNNGTGVGIVEVYDLGSGTPGSTPTPTPTATPTTTHFAVSAPGTVAMAVPFSITVTAQDQFNNTVGSYPGTVHFTSTSAGNLPADSTLTNGTGTFQAWLLTQGNQTVTATDSVNASITGTTNIFVGPPPPPTPRPDSDTRS